MKQFFRKQFGVQLMLDGLRNYYYWKEDSDYKYSSNRSLNELQLKQIRGYLLHVSLATRYALSISCCANINICPVQAIELMIADTIELDEVQSIIYFIQDCTESLQLVDVLTLLYFLIAKEVKHIMVH